MERLWDFSSWDLGKVAITATAVDFCGSEKRASGEVAVSGDPSCSWCAFWLGESCKHQQFFALFGVLIDWDSDHGTCLLTLGSKKKRQCSIKGNLAYLFISPFPHCSFEFDPEFLQDNSMTQTKSLFQQLSRLPRIIEPNGSVRGMYEKSYIAYVAYVAL